MVLGQQAVDEKANELIAIPELLKQLDLDGALVSIDAIACNPAIAQEIVDAGLDDSWTGFYPGHALVAAGFDPDGLKVIHRGRFYAMTWRFFSKAAVEAYAIADPTWIAATGRTPGGLSPDEIRRETDAFLASRRASANAPLPLLARLLG